MLQNFGFLLREMAESGQLILCVSKCVLAGIRDALCLSGA